MRKTSLLMIAAWVAAFCTSGALGASPVPVDDLNTHARNLLRYLSPDGLTAFMLHTDVPNGNWVNYSQTRVDLDSPFLAPDRFPFSSIGYKPSVVASSDLLTLFCSATGVVYEYTRLSVHDEFANGRVLPSLSDGYATSAPKYLSADGLRLYLSVATVDRDDLAVATRESVSEDFGTPSLVLFEFLNTPEYNDGTPVLSPDELEIVFNSNRPGAGSYDLYYASRPSIDAAFGLPVPLTDLNGPDGETPSAWWGDTLYFGWGGTGEHSDVYMVGIPEPATLGLLALGGLALLRKRRKA